VALDIAGRRDGDVHAGEIVVGFFRVAGMILDLAADLVAETIHLV
jgi:hypothetical protein